MRIDADASLIPGCNSPVNNEDIKVKKEKVFLFYPNPVISDKMLMLSRISMADDYNLIISDLQGKEIKRIKFK